MNFSFTIRGQDIVIFLIAFVLGIAVMIPATQTCKKTHTDDPPPKQEGFCVDFFKGKK